jgi:3-hydroxyisobutyrate dehydrogenase
MDQHCLLYVASIPAKVANWPLRQIKWKLYWHPMMGFAGLGLMGEPMAANLRRAGVALTVYNRSPKPRHVLESLGANAVDNPDALFAQCDVVILMMRDDGATDFVLDRSGASFAKRVGGRLIINMGTHSPDYSLNLEREIRAAGGAFVEAPVSGSRGPAEAGTLVAMLAGEVEAVERARPLLKPMCREVRAIGKIPSAMSMKLAINLYLIATVASLAEAANLAQALNLDLRLFHDLIRTGPLCSDVAMAKLDKIARRDFAPQAAIQDVCKNATLVAEVAAGADVHAPLLSDSRRLFEEALQNGSGDLDMAAVFEAFSKRR